MTRGKHVKKKSWTKRKLFLLVVAVAILIIALAGMQRAFAWLKDSSGSITNTFTPSRVSCEIYEDDFKQGEGIEKTNAGVTNTGDVEAYIRVSLIFNWKNGESIAAGSPEKDKDYIMSLNTEDWILGSDGFYYCKMPVAPKGKTPVLINSCKVRSADESKQLQLEIIASAIQSRPFTAAKEAWGVILQENKDIPDFGMVLEGGRRP